MREVIANVMGVIKPILAETATEVKKYLYLSLIGFGYHEELLSTVLA
jgi:hypothetical protein